MQSNDFSIICPTVHHALCCLIPLLQNKQLQKQLWLKQTTNWKITNFPRGVDFHRGVSERSQVSCSGPCSTSESPFNQLSGLQISLMAPKIAVLPGTNQLLSYCTWVRSGSECPTSKNKQAAHSNNPLPLFLDRPRQLSAARLYPILAFADAFSIQIIPCVNSQSSKWSFLRLCEESWWKLVWYSKQQTGIPVPVFPVVCVKWITEFQSCSLPIKWGFP